MEVKKIISRASVISNILPIKYFLIFCHILLFFFLLLVFHESCGQERRSVLRFEPSQGRMPPLFGAPRYWWENAPSSSCQGNMNNHAAVSIYLFNVFSLCYRVVTFCFPTFGQVGSPHLVLFLCFFVGSVASRSQQQEKVQGFQKNHI